MSHQPPHDPSVIRPEIERIDPAFDRLISKDAELETLAGGFIWTEGPVWKSDEAALLFSDVPANRIYRYRGGQTDLYLEPSGYTGAEPFVGKEPGSNGLTLDDEGRLVMCCHGDHGIARLEQDGQRRMLVDSYEGMRLNSPNDLVYRRTSGDLYFTDPPYGLPEGMESPLGFNGVYCLRTDGTLELVSDEMTRPNGIAFFPGERRLVVSQSDKTAAIWNLFPLRDDGTLDPPFLFFDATHWVGNRPGSPDGMKFDREGNLWATAPGGVLVLAPTGELLGRISTGGRVANVAWGDDGATLYICAHHHLCRIRTRTKGFGFDG